MLMHGRDYPQQKITTLSSIYLLHLLRGELLLWPEDGVAAGVVAAPPAPAVRVQRGRAQAAQVVAAHLSRQQLLQHGAIISGQMDPVYSCLRNLTKVFTTVPTPYSLDTMLGFLKLFLSCTGQRNARLA